MSLGAGRTASGGGLGILTVAAGLAVAGIFLLAIAVPTAEARGPVRRATELQLQIPPTLRLGEHPPVTVRLTSDGAPVAGELVSIHLGTRVSQQVKTGADGTGSADIARDLPAATYVVTATFAGSATFISSSSLQVTFTISPVELTILTVPVIPNIPLLSVGDGATLKTDESGTVKVLMYATGPVALKMALPSDEPNRRLSLDRWDDGSTDPVRSIRIPDTLQVTVALRVFYPVQFSFHASDGEGIPSTRVSSLDIADSAGALQTLAGPVTYWLQGNVITRLVNGLDSAAADYRILSVLVDGSEVVVRGQQHFGVGAAETVAVPLLIFVLDIQGRDALLRTTSGSTARVTSGAGVTQVVPLDARGRASIRLPRGDYHIVLHGGFGVPLSTPVALSRDQGVDILFVSLVDMVLAVGLGLVVMFGLIAVGRPHLIRGRATSGTDGQATKGEPATPTPGPAWPDPSSPRELPRRGQRPRSGP